jgi:hypothetical protein
MSVVVRYLPRQLADQLLTRGAAMLVVGIVILLPFLLRVDGGALQGEQLRVLFVASIGNVTTFLTLIATYGIVGQDIRQGYYRFVLSKPLSPAAYYGAAFGVTLAGYLITLLVLTGVFAVVRGPVWPGLTAFANWTIGFVLIGSLVFAFSRFTRLDWIFALLVFLLGDVARRRWPAGESVWGAVLNVLLPPAGQSAFSTAGHPRWGHILWLLGYAAVMVALGLLAVRYVPPGERR